MSSSGSNLYRSQNYLSYVDQTRPKTKIEKSISDVEEKKKIDGKNVLNGGDNESINSCESLNNYLDAKVGVYDSLNNFIIHHFDFDDEE